MYRENIRKAFDSVPHHPLIHKLEELGLQILVEMDLKLSY